ncbi:hypothetical protein B5J92_04690 [Moraxella atlantae]|nr:hypothetical protein B5J92_04690 [Moraxella atlantae]
MLSIAFFQFFLPFGFAFNNCLFLLALLVSRRSVSAYYTRFFGAVKGVFQKICKKLGFLVGYSL